MDNDYTYNAVYDPNSPYYQDPRYWTQEGQTDYDLSTATFRMSNTSTHDPRDGIDMSQLQPESGGDSTLDAELAEAVRRSSVSQQRSASSSPTSTRVKKSVSHRHRQHRRRDEDRGEQGSSRDRHRPTGSSSSHRSRPQRPARVHTRDDPARFAMTDDTTGVRSYYADWSESGVPYRIVHSGTQETEYTDSGAGQWREVRSEWHGSDISSRVLEIPRADGSVMWRPRGG